MNCIDQVIGQNFALYHGDCVEVLRGLPPQSIDYSIFSPPFASLFTSMVSPFIERTTSPGRCGWLYCALWQAMQCVRYSNSPRDMGNCKGTDEFFVHFGYLVAELRRVMRPGREVSFHCMLMPTSKERDGYIGLRDFRGELIRAFQQHGFIHHSEVVIWKDPVTAM